MNLWFHKHFTSVFFLFSSSLCLSSRKLFAVAVDEERKKFCATKRKRRRRKEKERKKTGTRRDVRYFKTNGIVRQKYAERKKLFFSHLNKLLLILCFASNNKLFAIRSFVRSFYYEFSLRHVDLLLSLPFSSVYSFVISTFLPAFLPPPLFLSR